jgi:hypothetical protein
VLAKPSGRPFWRHWSQSCEQSSENKPAFLRFFWQRLLTLKILAVLLYLPCMNIFCHHHTISFHCIFLLFMTAHFPDITNTKMTDCFDYFLLVFQWGPTRITLKAIICKNMIFCPIYLSEKRKPLLRGPPLWIWKPVHEVLFWHPKFNSQNGATLTLSLNRMGVILTP